MASVRVDRFGYVRIPPYIARQSYLCLAADFMCLEDVYVLWLGVVRTSLMSFLRSVFPLFIRLVSILA